MNRTSASSRTGPPARPFAIALAFVAAALLACADEDVTAQIGNEYIHVRITDQGLEPSQLRLETADQAILVVNNDTAERCRFSLGPWVRNLEVDGGAVASMGFTVTQIEADSAPMGCAGRAASGIVETDVVAP